MEKSFKPFWAREKEPEQAANEIIWGLNLEQYKQHIPQFLNLVNVSEELAKRPLRVLDFGCGLSRFLHHAGIKFSNWQFVGYDCPTMLRNARRVWEFTPNVSLQSDWEAVSKQKYDLINAEIVLMHILEPDVRAYLHSFKTMLSDADGKPREPGKDGFIGFFHATRETLDDEKTNVWDIVFDCGFTPVEKYYGEYKTGNILANAAAMLKVAS